MKLRTSPVLIYAVPLVLLSSTAASVGAEKTFSFKDPKGVNAMYFLADSHLEPIMGLARGITGDWTFDPSHPDKLTGEVVVDASTVNTSNPEMTKHLHSEDWLNVGEHETITFKVDKVTKVNAKGENEWEMRVTGAFSLKGVTKDITIPIHVTLVPDGVAKRMRGGSGDLLMVRTKFKIDRSAFGIKPGKYTDKVANEIEITAPIVGTQK